LTIIELSEVSGAFINFKKIARVTGLAVSGIVVSSVFTIGKVEAAITNQQKNVVPAVLSFDTAIATLGLGFGIDYIYT
jgi:hypothetical protein